LLSHTFEEASEYTGCRVQREPTSPQARQLLRVRQHAQDRQQRH
jgi:hypothetical protein